MVSLVVIVHLFVVEINQGLHHPAALVWLEDKLFEETEFLQVHHNWTYACVLVWFEWDEFSMFEYAMEFLMWMSEVFF